MSHPLQGTQTPCQRSAVPSHERNALHNSLRPRSTHPQPTRPQPHAMAVRCDAQRFRPDTASACVPDLAPRFGPKKKRYSPHRLAIANKLYINARASAARFAHNVTAAGQQPRQAPAAANGWAAGVPFAWRAGVRAIGAAVGPAPSGRGPWGTVRGAALRRACVNRRPMDGQQRPRGPRAGGMFQPGIMKTKIFLPMLSNDIILYHAGRCCRA